RYSMAGQHGGPWSAALALRAFLSGTLDAVLCDVRPGAGFRTVSGCAWSAYDGIVMVPGRSCPRQRNRPATAGAARALGKRYLPAPAGQPGAPWHFWTHGPVEFVSRIST